jgi:hypothetical protein
MATEILVNDGGAPCRIIPVIAAAAITAGNALAYFDVAGLDAKVKPLKTGTTGLKDFAGVALTTVASGEVCNMIVGSGSIVRILCTNVAGGVPMMPDNVSGQLKIFTATGTAPSWEQVVAITVEDGAAGLVKCRLC